MPVVRLVVLFCLLIFPLFAQNPILTCAASANPPVVRGEGIAERMGDILLNCAGGQPAASITGTLTIFLSVPISNRVLADGTAPDVIFTADNGSGPQQLPIRAVFLSNSLAFNGITVTLSPAGTVTLRILNVRGAANATGLVQGAQIFADLAFNGSSGTSLLTITNNHFTVGTPQRSLFATFASKLVCAPRGARIPDTLSFSDFVQTGGAAFATVRITEGFASSFANATDFASYRADTPSRIVIRYASFPINARIFVPDVIAGSSARTPTAAGDLGLTPSGGQYLPGSGTLVLSRVAGADSTGAGGSPVYVPGPPGSALATFDNMAEIDVSTGNGFVVYQVMDSNPTTFEFAQIPTFLGYPQTGGAQTFQTEELVTLGPVSTVGGTSAVAPIPRFLAVTPLPDCQLIGDCSANYFPHLWADTTEVDVAAHVGDGIQPRYIPVQNLGGGVMQWSAAAKYQSGTGWLAIENPTGVNNATIRVDVTPGTLPQGSYAGSVTVDAGAAGSRRIPYTLTLGPPGPPPPQPPLIQSVVSAANIGPGPVVPGSLATIYGSRFSGKIILVTFDGLPGKIFFSNDTQINLLVPIELGQKTSTLLAVVVDGLTSALTTVPLAPFFPGIFPGAVLNQDSSVNSVTNPAKVGSVIQIFATGLPAGGVITAKIGDTFIASPYYAGAAPGLTGVQQVNLVVPSALQSGNASVTVCGALAVNPDSRTCSPPVTIAVTQ